MSNDQDQVIERRRHPRRKLDRSALLYDSQGLLYPCQIDNISSDGLFIKIDGISVHKDSYIHVMFGAIHNMTKPIVVEALVMYKKEEGIGLLCGSDSPLHELLRLL